MTVCLDFPSGPVVWTSLVVQWLRLHTSTAGGAGGVGLIPGQRRGSSLCRHAMRPKKKKRLCAYLQGSSLQHRERLKTT